MKWLREGWIDYVTPQAYWHIGFDIADHQKISEWWDTNSYNKNLYIRLNQTLRKKIYPYPALIPVNPDIPGKTPPAPGQISVKTSRDSVVISWKPNFPADKKGYFAVYRSRNKEEINFDDPSYILLITSNPVISLKKRFFLSRKKYKIIVTAVSRTHYESEPGEPVKVKY